MDVSKEMVVFITFPCFWRAYFLARAERPTVQYIRKGYRIFEDGKAHRRQKK